MPSHFQNWNRRRFLEFMGMGMGAGVLASCSNSQKQNTAKSFQALSPQSLDEVVTTEGLSSNLLVRWEDVINVKGERFGFNNDFVAAIEGGNDQLLLWVNHEYIDPLIVSGYQKSQGQKTKAQIDKERLNVGGSFLGLKKSSSNQWELDLRHKASRRIDARTRIPFAWNEKIAGATEAEGTLGNCAGGQTDWGTVLTAEENYQDYYGEVSFEKGQRKWKAGKYDWHLSYDRPPEHYGWIVEIDPQTGNSKKLVAMGRFAHEGATFVRSPEGFPVVYSGDDDEDQFLYKFVSDSKDNLDRGKLYVANLVAGRWLLLDRESNPVLKEAFGSQTELLIRTREAAQLAGATPLDRPEDVEVDPLNGDVIVALTNNIPKGNYHGSLLRIREKAKDYAGTDFEHDQFLLGGVENGFSCPDNLAFDSKGNLWMTSDISGKQMEKKPYRHFGNNGLFLIQRSGPFAGQPLQVASAPRRAEFTGPCFYGESLFLSVQHPGEYSKSKDQWESHWPNGKNEVPRPALIELKGKFFEQLGIS